MPVNLLTLEERLQIEELVKRDATFPQIGLLLGRSKHTIRNEVRRMGGRDSYSAKKAQHLCDTAYDRRRKSMLKYIAATKKPITVATIKKRNERLSKRVDILEQKVELLTQLIQESNAIHKKL